MTWQPPDGPVSRIVIVDDPYTLPDLFPPEPPACHIDDRLFYRLQWLVYGGVGVLVAGVVLAIYRTCRIVLEYFSESLTK